LEFVLPDAALMFEADPLTEAIVIFGEIGFFAGRKNWRN
jgi:succinyl-CoA synthetase alpha subunit